MLATYSLTGQTGTPLLPFGALLLVFGALDFADPFPFGPFDFFDVLGDLDFFDVLGDFDFFDVLLPLPLGDFDFLLPLPPPLGDLDFLPADDDLDPLAGRQGGRATGVGVIVGLKVSRPPLLDLLKDLLVFDDCCSPRRERKVSLSVVVPRDPERCVCCCCRVRARCSNDDNDAVVDDPSASLSSYRSTFPSCSTSSVGMLGLSRC